MYFIVIKTIEVDSKLHLKNIIWFIYDSDWLNHVFQRKYEK